MWIPGYYIPNKSQTAGINSEEEGKNKKMLLKIWGNEVHIS